MFEKFNNSSLCSDMFEKFNNSDPGLLIHMINMKDDPSSINVNRCIKLGSISQLNIMDLTLLNSRLPVNIYNSNSTSTNFGIILNTDKLIPKNFPNKYIQCLSVRDSGSNLRRCDTKFNDNKYTKTIGKYRGLELIKRSTKKCNCKYVDSISNVCNTKAEVVGCGAKCSDKGKICGQVNWCDWNDFRSEPNIQGLDCATHPKDINQWIDATVAWNKHRIQKMWNVEHPENELDAYIVQNDENQQMIIDSIECFVFTEMCGKNPCSQEIQTEIQKYMEIATNDFNKFYNKNVPLYKLLIDTSKNTGAFKNGEIISWENNEFKSDLKSLLIPIKLDPTKITQPASMYTYRVADKIDGISGKNTGDIKGDNSYISGEFCYRHGDDFCKNSLITEYKVNYIPIPQVIEPKIKKDGTICKYKDRNNTDCMPIHKGFGNYALCNPGGVIGGNVEKNGAYICTICNDKTIPNYKNVCKNAPGVELDRFSGGKWFSWPTQTECKDDVSLGTNGCNWKVDKKTKTFKISELIDKDYKILSTNKYNEIISPCKDKSCISEKVSEFVTDNSEGNINVLNKAFGRS